MNTNLDPTKYFGVKNKNSQREMTLEFHAFMNLDDCAAAGRYC